MYPSTSDLSFGTFVKTFHDGVICLYPDYIVDIVAIRGRSRSKTGKLIKYTNFYCSLLFKLLIRKYDIVYVHTLTYPTPPIRIVSLFKNLNLIFNAHGVDVLTKSRLAERLKQLCRPLLKKSKFIVVPTPYFRDIVKSEFPEIKTSQILISPSGGVEKNFFYSTIKNRNYILNIGYVSRIVKGKGWDTFVHSLMLLRKRGINFKATLVGTGNHIADLEKCILESKLSDCIHFLGPIGHDELPNYYKNLDVFVFPSENNSESLGLVGLEAMASSVPVIGSNIGGITSYLKDSINGFIFPSGNAEALADCIYKIATMSDQEYSELSTNAFLTASEYESSYILKVLFTKLFS